MFRNHLAALAAAAILLAACGGETVSPGNNPPPPPPPAAISIIELTPPTASVDVGKTTPLVATPRDAAGLALTGRTLSWMSSSPAVATVETNGVVHGVAAGTAFITVSAAGKTAAAAITVTSVAGAPVATVTVAPALDTIEAYDPKIMTAVLRDAKDSVLKNRVVRWTSSNPWVATIDSVTGQLLGLDRGTVTITATSEAKIGSASRVIVIKYRSMAAGSMHACDISSGGFVWCWGLNGREGRIGGATMGDNAMSTAPVYVPNTGWYALRFTQLSSYGTHTCGITVDAKAYCWGNNSWGQLGAASNVSQSNTPLLVAGNLSFRQISAGADHSCGVTTDNRAYCWGHNDWRQFASNEVPMSTSPVAVAPELSFVSISAGSGFTCGVATTGFGRCWGASGLGQIGDGSKISYGNTFSVTPRSVAMAPLHGIEAGPGFACGLDTFNEAVCWGSNGGRLGNGPTGTDESAPVMVSGGRTFSSLSTGNGFTCGVTTDAAVWCWGTNDNGQLGVDVPPVATSPVRAGGSLRAAEVATAGVSTGFGRHTCVISQDRLSAFCFGRNETGQLGNGNTSTATAVNPTPTLVVGQKPLP